jgi:exodeoxyribonuclease VII large subunit
LDELTIRQEQAVRAIVQQIRARVERVAGAVALLSPRRQVSGGWELLQDAFARLRISCAHRVDMLQSSLETAIGKLDSLSPLAVLARGYSLAWRLPEEALLRDARALSEGDAVRLQLHKGSALLSVDEVYPAGD